MSDTLTRLEASVATAVRRIGELTAERDELAGELRRLRARVEELAASRLDATGGAAWAAERRRTLGELRATLDELRAG